MKTANVLIVVGPTASGKSTLGVALAKRFNGEVISADSRQVYKGLDIGTGKITKKEMRGIPHHLLNVTSPKKTFTAQNFLKHGRAAIADISSRGKLPIVVGGTGFYIDVLVGRIVLPEVPPNTALRKKLAQKSARELFALLKKKDPKRAKMLSSESERNNKVRLIRALEIAASSIRVTHPRASTVYNALWIGIAPDEKILNKKIQLRLTKRIQGGMIQEAKKLKKGGLSLKRMEELGLEYRSLSRYLKGTIDKKELQEELSRDIQRYAKKQKAYWKRNSEIRWFKPSDILRMKNKIEKWRKTLSATF